MNPTVVWQGKLFDDPIDQDTRKDWTVRVVIHAQGMSSAVVEVLYKDAMGQESWLREKDNYTVQVAMTRALESMTAIIVNHKEALAATERLSIELRDHCAHVRGQQPGDHGDCPGCMLDELQCELRNVRGWPE